MKATLILALGGTLVKTSHAFPGFLKRKMNNSVILELYVEAYF